MLKHACINLKSIMLSETGQSQKVHICYDYTDLNVNSKVVATVSKSRSSRLVVAYSWGIWGKWG